MQKKHLCTLLLVGISAILLTSCSKTNTEGRLVPKEASIVIRLNGKSLSSKLSWDEIKQNPLFLDIKSDSGLPAALKSLLDNPDNAGIETNSECLFFAVKDSLGGYIGFEGKVKDEAIFKTFNKQMAENGVESEKDDIQFISKLPFCVGFTKDKFIYVFDAPQFSRMDELTKRMKRDSLTPKAVSGRDIGATCKFVFALKEDNSLAKEEKFTSLMKETGDLYFWMNGEELSKGGSSASALDMMNLDRFYKGNITAATMNFENGKMIFNGKTYANEDIIALFKKYSGGKVDEDMIKRIPGKDIVAMMAINFKPEAIRDFIKMSGFDGLVNIGVKNFGFTLDDFIKANKGDILFGVSDLAMKTDTTTYKFKDQPENMSFSMKPDFNFIFSASIGDKPSFDKIISAGQKMTGDKFNDSSKFPLSYNSNGTYFVMSNNKQNTGQYLSKPGVDFDFINKIGGEPFAGYLNIQTLLRAFNKEAARDSSAKIIYDASLKLWDNIIWKGGKYNNGGIEQHVEINLVDKTTNSLKQLNQYAAKLSELYKEERRKQKEESMAFQDFQSSDTMLPPPTKSK